MTHIRPISRTEQPTIAEMTFLETIIILVMNVYFQSWDNYASVIQNLQKYYEKT